MDLKLNESYEKYKLTPIVTKRGRQEFERLCLTKVYEFRRLLLSKGHLVQCDDQTNGTVRTITLSIDNLTGYLFTIDKYVFEYKIFRRLR